MRSLPQPLPVTTMTTETPVFFDSFKWEGGQLVRKRVQPTEDRILEHNARMRNEPEAFGNLSFAGLELCIPLLHLERLQKKYPDLKSTDGKTRTNAWLAFMGSAEADPYRVRHRSRARQ